MQHDHINWVEWAICILMHPIEDEMHKSFASTAPGWRQFFVDNYCLGKLLINSCIECFLLRIFLSFNSFAATRNGWWDLQA